MGHKLSYESCRPIRYLHISHNAPYLTPKILQKHMFSISLRTAVLPRENEKQRLCNILWGKQGAL